MAEQKENLEGLFEKTAITKTLAILNEYEWRTYGCIFKLWCKRLQMIDTLNKVTKESTSLP